MRAFRWAFMLFGLSSFTLTASPSPFPVTEVIRWDHVWKYEPSGTNLAPYGWMMPEYDDSAWYSGRPVFATFSEPLPTGRTNNTTLQLNPSGTAPILTIYFRTLFPWSNSGPITLTFSNLIDDGAIFYLNGQELRRIGMPLGAVDNRTLANRQGDVVASYGYDVFTINDAPLVIGPNVLAVELHNSAVTSGDMVFGCYMSAGIIDPPCFGVPPTRNVEVLECRSTNLISVFTDTSYLSVQWLRDDAPIPGATNPVYTISHAGSADAGMYVCRATYPQVTCDQGFNVTYIADDNPLIIAEAVGALDLTNILARFSLPVDEASATDLFNYSIEGLELEGATVLSNRTDVLLATTARHPGGIYHLGVNGPIFAAADVCPQAVLSFQEIPIDLEQEVLPFDAEWRYDQSGTDLGAAWRMREYDDSAWPRGRSLLGAEAQNTLDMLRGQGLYLNTSLPVADGMTTYYFRTEIDVRFKPANGTFTLWHVIDDGAVFYVNGVEAGRFNMPSGPISYATFAPTTLPEGVVRSIELPGFATGTNVIAVEVHQLSSNDGDVLFGARLIGVASVSAAPKLAIGRNPDGKLMLSWTDRATLQEAAVPGEWSDSLDQSNPQTISASHAARFYRLAQ